jgi:hypothetical protein
MTEAYSGWMDGGPSGLYPTYNFREAIELVWAGAGHNSPYENAEVHDPNADMDDAAGRLAEYQDIADDMDPEASWEALLASSVAQANSLGLGATVVTSGLLDQSASGAWGNFMAQAETEMDEHLLFSGAAAAALVAALNVQTQIATWIAAAETRAHDEYKFLDTQAPAVLMVETALTQIGAWLAAAVALANADAGLALPDTVQPALAAADADTQVSAWLDAAVTDANADAGLALPLTVQPALAAADADTQVGAWETAADTKANANSFPSTPQDELSTGAPETLWAAWTADALTAVDTVLPTAGAEILAAVEAFDGRQELALARSVSRMAAGMAELDMVDSSQFYAGWAIIERGALADVADFNARLTLQTQTERMQSILGGVGQVLDIERLRGQLTGDRARVVLEMVSQQLDADKTKGVLTAERARGILALTAQQLEADRAKGQLTAERAKGILSLTGQQLEADKLKADIHRDRGQVITAVTNQMLDGDKAKIAVMESQARTSLEATGQMLEYDKLKSIATQERAKVLMGGLKGLFDMLRLQAENSRMTSVLQMEFAKANAALNSGYTQEVLRNDVEAEMWNINLLGEPQKANMISGAPVLRPGVSQGQGDAALLMQVVGSILGVVPNIISAIK